MWRIIIILAFFAFGSNYLYSQTKTFQEQKSLPVPSANAASLGKFVEFPMSIANGVPNISIPIYEVKSGDISVPITLGYNSSGIRVSEEAGWVGLGWSLQAGGMISRDIKGMDDRSPSTQTKFEYIFPGDYSTAYSPAIMNEYQYSNCEELKKRDGSFYTFTEIYNNLTEPKDGEPDLYIFNFGGYSGKFIYSNGVVYDLGKSNVKFSLIYSDSIIAITPDGYKYSFGEKEAGYTNYLAGNSSEDKITDNAFYLTQITSPTGKKVYFRYKNFRQVVEENLWSSSYENWSTAFATYDSKNYYALQLPSISQRVEVEIGGPESGHGPMLTSHFSTSWTKLLYLDKVEFDNGYVEFKKGTRLDQYGLKLENIIVYNKQNEKVKEFSFNYDYFIGKAGIESFSPGVQSDGFRKNYPENYRKKRLKLLSIQEAGRYSFEYYDGGDYTLPYKSSFEQDYWGYYNGRSCYTLVPDFQKYWNISKIPDVFSTWKGANREADSAKVKAGLIKRIVYPTKGWDAFEFQSNQYTNLNSQTITTTVNKVAQDIGKGFSEKVISINSSRYVTLNGTLWCGKRFDGADNGGCVNGYIVSSCGTRNTEQNPLNRLYAVLEKLNTSTGKFETFNNAYFDHSILDIISCSNPLGTGSFKQERFLLDPGTYRIIANYPDNQPLGQYGERMSMINLSYDSVNIVNPIGIGGGVRVSKIRKYDPVSKKVMSKSYDYSSGILYKFPNFYQVTLGQKPTTTGYVQSVFYTLSCHTLIPYSFSSNGSLVGYRKVVEKFSDNSLGKVEYQYSQNEDKFKYETIFNNNSIYGPADGLTHVEGIPTTAFPDNGFNLSTVYYGKTNEIVKEVIQTPSFENTSVFWSYKYGSTDYSSNGRFCASFYARFYPIILGKLVVKTSTEKEYVNNVLTLEKSSSYSYNADLNLIKEETKDSKGLDISTQYTYPSDYTVSTGWVQDLKVKNMINVPIEVLNKNNGKVVGGSYTVYKKNNEIITPNEFYKIETITPATISSTAPSNTLPSQFKLEGKTEYDSKGNLLYVQASNNVITSYLWGYNETLPIAIITNALAKDVFYASFEDASGNSSDGDAKTGRKSVTNGFQKSITGLTNGNYILSYFQKVNGKWEYKSTNVTVTTSSYSINLSSTLQIDEVRFQPATARMTTFTYDPLVGMTSQTDENNLTTYFSYDGYKRLWLVKDSDGNILNKYDYQYME